MRHCWFTLLVTAGLLVPAVAPAAAPPNNMLFAGTIARNYLATGGSSWCLFEGTNSSFVQRGGLTLISFPDIVIAPTGSIGPAYTVGGQARLVFNSTTTGTVYFVPVDGNPTNINQPYFTGYQATYDSATQALRVLFWLRFPDCAIPVTATYRN